MRRLHRIEWEARMDPGLNARRKLPQLMTEYFEVVRALLKDNPAPQDLHQIRLASKRVRYTLELFRPCYGPGLEERLNALRGLQRVLGEVNDAAATQQLFEKTMNTDAPQRQQVIQELKDRAEAKAKEFHKQWHEVFDAPGQFEWWIQYLERHGRSPVHTA